MSDRTKRRWSYASAGALTLITLFVFGVFQNFGPESAVRRFHAVGTRVASYVRPGQPFDILRLKPGDLDEVAAIADVLADPGAASWLMEGLALPVARSGASYQVVRLDYQSPTLVIAVVQYSWPDIPEPQFYVWVVRQVGVTWKIDPKETVDLWMRLRPGH